MNTKIDIMNRKVELVYKIDVTIENKPKTLEFGIKLLDLEDDLSVLLLIENELEDYIQDTYCTCSFNESQNHCDCETNYSWDYNYELINIYISKANP